jgi:D-methionine transport system permease protein
MMEFFTNLFNLLNEFKGLLLVSTWQTLYITLISTLIAYLLGIPLGIWVVSTAPNSIAPNRPVHEFMSRIINIGRSIPFIILLVALLPVTRMLVGTTIGPTATIVPMTIAAVPFVARMIEQSLVEVDNGLIEMGQAMGATSFQIIFKVLLTESLPSIIRGISITIINLIGYSAMAGAVGGGGLGDLAIRYGYHRRQTDIMMVTIVLLILVVEVIQMGGNAIASKIDKRNVH